MNIKTRLANAEQEARSGFCSRMALNAALRGHITWSTWQNETEGNGKHRVGVFGLNRADGGFCVVSYRYPDQEDYTSAYYYGEYIAGLRHGATPQTWALLTMLTGCASKLWEAA